MLEMNWIAIIGWFIVLISSHMIFYRIGFKHGGGKVLNEWKAWNDEVYGITCPHGKDWDYCPDCRH